MDKKVDYGTASTNTNSKVSDLPLLTSWTTEPSTSSMSNTTPSANASTTGFKLTGTVLPTIDYVLVYSKSKLEEEHTKMEQRIKFEDKLKRRGFLIEETPNPYNPDHIFVKMSVTFESLCKEAEKIKIELPLKGIEAYDDGDDCVEKCWKFFETDTEVDFVSAPFIINRFHMYEGNENKDTFFSSAMRSYLCHHILIRTDIRDKSMSVESFGDKMALPYLLMKDVYIDWCILHDISANDVYFTELKTTWMYHYHPELSDSPKSEVVETTSLENGTKKSSTESVMSVEEIEKLFAFTCEPDNRKKLDDTWPKLHKFQPSWRIRNYFGEKVAFYYAWSGHLITYLWFPMLFGFAVFLYGLYASVNLVSATNSTGNPTTTPSSLSQIISLVDLMLSTVKSAFDNDVTPYFAIIICIWSTVFTETWKRYKARLAYEWDVDNFDDIEPDRAQFVGTEIRPDPVTKEESYYYPITRQLLKLGTSLVVLLFMICIVLIAVAGIILYRVFVTVKVCPNVSSVACLVLNMIISSLLNAIAILILGKLYEFIAYKLTDWENHRTQTSYDDALIIKLFAFQFANNYTSLFYIAFFKGSSLFTSNGIFGLGEAYVDTCGSDNNCMAATSFQMLILMLVKPFPKLFADVVVPKIRICCAKIRKKNKVDSEMSPSSPMDINHYIHYELEKPQTFDFIIGEYMEKVIQYGFLMLFTASFSLAPLIAFLTNLFDRYTDSKRLLWMYRRPIPYIVSDIGIWQSIVLFLNTVGVMTNAALIAFTSHWSDRYNLTQKLMIVLGVEHAVFALKLFLDAIIPDVPSDVSLNIRREKFQLTKLLEADDSFKKRKFSQPPPDLVHRDSELYPPAKSHPSLIMAPIGSLHMLDGIPDPVPYNIDDNGPESPIHRRASVVDENRPLYTADDSNEETKVTLRKEKKKKKRRHRDENVPMQPVNDPDAPNSSRLPPLSTPKTDTYE